MEWRKSRIGLAEGEGAEDDHDAEQQGPGVAGEAARLEARADAGEQTGELPAEEDDEDAVDDADVEAAEEDVARREERRPDDRRVVGLVHVVLVGERSLDPRRLAGRV